MSNEFDDLSDDFLNNGEEPKKPDNNNKKKIYNLNNLDDLPSDLPPEILNIIKAISDIKLSDDILDINDDSLNNPFRITIDNISGDIDGQIRNIFTDTSTSNPNELSLEDRLQNAIENEDYNKAAEIRDLISEKKENKKSSEKLDTEGDSDTDIWDLLN